MTEQLIRMAPTNPLFFSREQFEEVRRAVISRALTSDLSPGDDILAGILLDQESRYEEIRRQPNTDKNSPTHYVFLDVSGSCVHPGNAEAQARRIDAIREIQEPYSLFAFSTDVALLNLEDVSNPDKLSLPSLGTDIHAVEKFLRNLPEYPDKVTIVSDGCFDSDYSRQHPERWNFVDIR